MCSHYTTKPSLWGMTQSESFLTYTLEVLRSYLCLYTTYLKGDNSSHYSLTPITVQSGHYKQNSSVSLCISILQRGCFEFFLGNGFCPSEYSSVLRIGIILFHQPIWLSTNILNFVKINKQTNDKTDNL